MQALQNPYLRQNPTSYGAAPDNNGAALSVEDYRINLDYSNYLRQSGIQVLGRAAANLVPNTALEVVRGVGNLYELGKRGVNLVESGDYSVNNLLFGNLDKDDNDFGNTLTEYADKYKNPFGEIYNRDNSQTFDFGSGAWWANAAQSTLPTVLGFAAESVALGTGLARAGVKFAEFLGAGVRGADAARKIAQGLTAFAVTKNESYMMANQTFDKVKTDYIAKYIAQNPDATEEDIKAVSIKANQAAGKAASAVDGIYTALALPGNITGLSSIFSSSSSLDDFFRKGGGAKMTLEEASQVGVDNPFVQKQLAKKRAFNTEALREAGFEGLEEVEGQYAQASGENFQDEEATVGSAVKNLNNFFKYTLNSEGALNLFFGSFMGGTQTAILENVPYHRVNKLDNDGRVSVSYDEEGKPVIQKEWVNSRTRDVYGKLEKFNSYKDAFQHDADYIKNIQQQIQETDNPLEKEDLRRKLFDLQAFDSVKKGTSDQLVNSIKQITSISNQPIDNSEMKNQLDDLQGQIKQGLDSEEKKKQLTEAKETFESILNSGEETDEDNLRATQGQLDKVNQQLQLPVLTDEDKQNNAQLIQQSDQLRKQLVDFVETTPAIQAGLAKDKNDNSYVEKGNQAIQQIKELQKFYDKQKKVFGESALDLPEYATNLYATILSRENLASTQDAQLDKQRADLGLFQGIDDLIEVDNYIKQYTQNKNVEDYDLMLKDYNDWKEDKTKTDITKWVNNVRKDTWNQDELHKAIGEELTKRSQDIKERQELLKSDIANTKSYQDYLKGGEDTEDTFKKYLKDLYAKSEDFQQWADFTANLDKYKQATSYLRDRLSEVTNAKGSQNYIRKSIQQTELAKRVIEEQINQDSITQAKIENARVYYENKIKKLNSQYLKVIDKEITLIKENLESLKTQNKPSDIASYFDNFLKRFARAANNEELIRRYEKRIDDLEEHARSIKENEQIEINNLNSKKKDSEKAKIINNKKEEILQQEKTGIDTTISFDEIQDEEIEESEQVVEKPTEVKVPKKKVVEQISYDTTLKTIKSIQNYTGLKIENLLRKHYTALSSFTKSQEVISYLLKEKILVKADPNGAIDKEYGERILALVKDKNTVVTTGNTEPIVQSESIAESVENNAETFSIDDLEEDEFIKPIETIQEDIQNIPEPIIQQIVQAKFTVEDLAEYLAKNGLHKLDTKSVEQQIVPYIAKIQQQNKIKFDNNVVNEGIEYFGVRFGFFGKTDTDRASNQKRYDLGIKLSQLYLTLTGLDKYNQEIKQFENKLVELTKPQEMFSVDDLEEDEEAVEEQTQLENIPAKEIKKLENPTYISDSLVPGAIWTISTNKANPFQLNADTLNLHDPNFLNVGDEIRLVRQATDDAEAEKWRRGKLLTPETLVVRLYKGNEFIGYLSRDLYSFLPQTIIVNQLQNKEELTESEQKTLDINRSLLDKLKEETKDKQAELMQMRQNLFAMPSNTEIKTTITNKTGGDNLRGSSKLLSDSNLLADERVSLVLADNAGGTGYAEDVKFRSDTNDVISTNDIANFSRYNKSLPIVSLWVKYPSNIKGKSNIIPANIGYAGKDFDTLMSVLTAYSAKDKERLDFINTNFRYDINKPKTLEAFINQFFIFTYNSKNLDNKASGLTVFKDGNLKVKFNGKEEIFERGKPNSKFYSLLKAMMSETNKNVTLSSTNKDYKFGLNSTQPFSVPIFNNGRLQAKEYTNYNSYIAEYVSTDLTSTTNAPTTEPNYIVNPGYTFDTTPITQYKPVETKEEIQEESKVEKKKKKYAKETTGEVLKNNYDNVKFNINSSSINYGRQLINSLANGKFYDLKFSNGLLRGAERFTINPLLVKNQNGFNALGAAINKINQEEYNGFPVIKKDNKEVFIDNSTAKIFERSKSSNEVDINAVELYRQVMKTPSVTNKSVVLLRISNSTTREQLQTILKELCR